MFAKRIGFVLSSDEPERLASFYAFLLEVEFIHNPNTNHWLVEHPGGIRIDFYKPSARDVKPPRGRAISLLLESSSNLDPLRALQNWVSILIANGALIVEEPRMEYFGAECWLSDPDGNAFLICVLKEN